MVDKLSEETYISKSFLDLALASFNLADVLMERAYPKIDTEFEQAINDPIPDEEVDISQLRMSEVGNVNFQFSAYFKGFAECLNDEAIHTMFPPDDAENVNSVLNNYLVQVDQDYLVIDIIGIPYGIMKVITEFRNKKGRDKIMTLNKDKIVEGLKNLGIETTTASQGYINNIFNLTVELSKTMTLLHDYSIDMCEELAVNPGETLYEMNNNFKEGWRDIQQKNKAIIELLNEEDRTNSKYEGIEKKQEHIKFIKGDLSDFILKNKICY
jgi:hypothetical protein